MALKIKQMDVWAGELPDVPGGLADVLGGLAGTGANLEFLIARRDPANPGRGQVFTTPIKGSRAESAAKSAGLTRAQDITTLRVDGANKAGLGHRMMRAIADRGINVRGVSAAVIGGKFTAYLGFDSQADADRAAEALRTVDAGRRGRGGGGRQKKAAPRRKATARRK